MAAGTSACRNPRSRCPRSSPCIVRQLWILSHGALPNVIELCYPINKKYIYSNGYSLFAVYSLLKAAEEVHLPKVLREEYGGGLKEFVGSEASCFEGSDDETRFFTTQERQSLVLHLLHTLRAGPHDLPSLPGLKLVEGQAIIPKCVSAGIISQVINYESGRFSALPQVQ